MSDGTPFLRVAADRIGAPGSARIAGNNAIPRHQSRQLVLNHPDRREDGCHSNANCKSSDFESHSTGWESSIWGIPVKKTFLMDLHGYFADRLVDKKGVNTRTVKARMKRVADRTLGPDVVKEVLIEGACERNSP